MESSGYLYPNYAPEGRHTNFTMQVVVSTGREVVPVGAPLVMPDIDAPRGTPRWVERSFLLVFLEHATESGSITPEDRRVAVTIDVKANEWTVDPITPEDAEVVRVPTAVPIGYIFP